MAPAVAVTVAEVTVAEVAEVVVTAVVVTPAAIPFAPPEKNGTMKGKNVTATRAAGGYGWRGGRSRTVPPSIRGSEFL